MRCCATALLVALLVLPVVQSRAIPGAGRQLHGDATSTAISTGGLTSSTTISAGDSRVSTTTIAADGATAIATQTAAEGNHTKVVVAAGSAVFEAEHHGTAKKSPNWEDAPACPFAPTASNTVKDDSGRLWAWWHGQSCAFKGTANHSSPGPTWESAPACPPTLSPDRAVMDLSGRPRGWANNASCAFKLPGSSRKLLQKPSANEQGANKAGEKVLTVSSERPLSTDLPAADSKATMTKSVRTEGPDGDAVECTLISVPDPEKKTVHDQLKCEKAGKISITSVGDAGPAAPVNAASPPPSVADSAPTSADTGLTVPGTTPALSASVSAPGALPQATATNTVPLIASTDVTVDTSETTLEDTADLDHEPTDVDVIVPTAPLSVVPDTDVLLTATNRFGTTWEAAPVCVGKPSKRTAVQDTLGRLWWYEGGLSCAYRDAQGSSLYYAGYVQVKWESTPACHGEPTLTNSMADAESRLWGWDDVDGTNCKWVDKGGKAVRNDTMLQAVIALAAAESSEVVQPQAFGPSPDQRVDPM